MKNNNKLARVQCCNDVLILRDSPAGLQKGGGGNWGLRGGPRLWGHNNFLSQNILKNKYPLVHLVTKKILQFTVNWLMLGTVMEMTIAVNWKVSLRGGHEN